MPRFHLPAAAWGDEAWLEGDEARHLGQVLRVRAGGRVEVFDGCGRRAVAEVLELRRGRVRLRLGPAAGPSSLRPVVTLAQAVPKGKTMDLVVQKAVELGVARIQPLVTRHTVVRPEAGKAAKWRRTAVEACKQCGQDLVPELAEPVAVDVWLRGLAAPPGAGELRVLASLEPGSPPLREVLRGAGAAVESILVLIGPEGDFAAEELRAAAAAGFRAASLGRIVLRVETAGLFCLAAIRYEFAADGAGC
jgi:16S rRNA (uracil1498-N3)-methyltransferase